MAMGTITKVDPFLNNNKLTLFFLCGICAMFEHDGPLLDTRTSHVLGGGLK